MESLLKKILHDDEETVLFVDESSFHLFAHHEKTYAPVGLTPIVKAIRSRSPRFMVIGAAAASGRSFYQWTTESVTAEFIVDFLKKLLRYWPGKLRVIWDNAPVHRAQVVRDFLKTPRVKERLTLQRFPSYAPEINPVESIWAWLKKLKANRAFQIGGDLAAWLKEKTDSLKKNRELVMKIMQASPIIKDLM